MNKYSTQWYLQYAHDVCLKEKELEKFVHMVEYYHAWLIKHRILLSDVPFNDLSWEGKRKLIDKVLSVWHLL